MGFTIQLYCPEDDPDGVVIVERMNWTGVGAAFPKMKWRDVAVREKFKKECVYILYGFVPSAKGTGDDIKIYVGQTRSLRKRLDGHEKDSKKDFWERSVVFSSSKGLNKANVLWLECELIKRALAYKRCIVENGNSPREPGLSESEKSDMTLFLEQILQTLPLIGLSVFDQGRTARPNTQAVQQTQASILNQSDLVVVVPAQLEGFNQVFIGENCWYEIRVAQDKLDKIKYIAAYQTFPESAVTYYAPVQSIVPYGNDGKFKLIFSAPAMPLQAKIPLENATKGMMQAPRYTTLGKLLSAQKLMDLF
jgi:hypothetical protein